MQKLVRYCTVLFMISFYCLNAQDKIVLGYYPDWAPTAYGYTAEVIDYDNLTHIAHSFVWPSAEGNLLIGANFMYPQLIEEAHANGVKMIVAVGGAGPTSDNFAQMAENEATRTKFLDNLAGFVIANGYDGVDWDWEFPMNVEDGKLYTLLIKELRERFDQLNEALTISMATNPGAWIGQHQDYENMIQYLDWFGIMGYDMHGSWTDHAGHNAPLYAPTNDWDGSLHEAFRYLHITRTIPSEKLVMGVPFYGREFNASGLYESKPEGDDLTLLYVNAVDRINSGWDYFFDDVSKVPYLQNSDRTKIVTFDDTVSMEYKSDYIKTNNMAGVMIWAIGQDYRNGEAPLLAKLGKEFLDEEDPVEPTFDKVIAGYYPEWRHSSFPAHKIQYHNLTHLIHCFAWPTANGDLDMYSGLIYPMLNQQVHAAGKKILLALGGWGNGDGFAPMAADHTKREKFLNTLVQFIQDNNYDGIDWDWEFPEDAEEGQLYLTLIKELREKFNQISDSLIISMATNSGNWIGQRIPYAEMVPYLDWFGLMGYDYHGGWTDHSGHNAPLYVNAGEPEGSVDLSVKYLRDNRGIPAEKIVLGVPFYGKDYISSGLYQPQDGVADIVYSTAVSRMNSGWDYFFDDVSKVPYLQNSSRTHVVTFEDTISLDYKTNYVKNNELAGMMIWEITQDEINGKQDLLEKIGREFNLGNPPTNIEVLESYPNEIVLNQNYPNPFNPVTNIKYSIPIADPSDVQGLNTTLVVYDMLGQKVSTLVSENKSPGNYQVTFDAGKLSSGIYFYVLQVGNNVLSKKMILLK